MDKTDGETFQHDSKPNSIGLHRHMVTVLRSLGLTVSIFTDDHVPAHVHIEGDGIAKINLDDPNGPAFVWAKGMNHSEKRRALGLIIENQGMLRQRWRDIHGN